MTRRITILIHLTVYFLITSCTGYGLIYDDKRPDSSDNEQQCFDNLNSDCLLSVAMEIATSMSDKLARSEALKILAVVQYEFGHHATALQTIRVMPISALQFSTLSELANLALEHNNDTHDLLVLATAITSNQQQPEDTLAALILSAILYFEQHQPVKARQLVLQAIELTNVAIVNGNTILDPQFFKAILPKLLRFETLDLILRLFKLPVKPALHIAALVDYTIELKQSASHQSKQAKRAQQQQQQILHYWHQQNPQQQKLAQPALIKLLVNFNRMAIARTIRKQQTDVIARVIVSAVIIQQLTATKKILAAKTELVHLLRDVRHYLTLESLIIKQQPTIDKTLVTTYYADKFKLATLRAQAIADIALALSKTGKMLAAVQFAEQIQRSMGHIRGSTLTKIALHYALQGDINSALLTMESIHRPLNRAACLAQISAILARKGNLQRAIRIANRVDRQSWRDIAVSEISISQAQQNALTTAILSLKSIKRSYSAIYAMTGIARALQATQNKR